MTRERRGSSTSSARPEARRSNLAVPSNRFVGRVTESQELRRARAEGERLITIHGPAGVGKTRLALEHARSVMDTHLAPSGGAWLCPLSDCRTLDDACTAVATVLGIPFDATVAGQELAELLGQALASRGKVLLLLDGFEPIVLQARAAVSRWLELAPELDVLVTSRERLKLPAERCLMMAPMGVPPEDEANPEVLRRNDAVELFIRRAGARGASVGRTDEELRSICALVRRLEGIPLAIELCASKSVILGLGQILELLDHPLEILKSVTPEGPERHSSLRLAIDWSWQLLQEWQRDALAQCAAFRGGWSVEAAEAVLTRSGKATGDLDVLAVLSSLEDHSLIQAREHEGLAGEKRFSMFDSLQEYALEQLDRSDPRRQAERRHARYFSRACERWRSAVHGPRALAVLQRLSAERHNLVAVVERAVRAAVDPELTACALAVLPALGELFFRQGPVQPFLALAEAALACAAKVEVAPNLLGRALHARAVAKFTAGIPGGVDDVERSLELAISGGDEELAALAHIALAAFGWRQDQGLASRRHLETAHEISGHGHPYALVLTEQNLGMWEETWGDRGRAVAHYERALDHTRESGNTRLEAFTLGVLGDRHFERGELDDAIRLWGEAVEKLGAVLNPRWAVLFAGHIGRAMQEQGRLDEARAVLESALERHRALGDRYAEARRLTHLGHLELESGRPSEAIVKYQAALSMFRRIADPGGQIQCTTWLIVVNAELDRFDDAARCGEELDRLLATSAPTAAGAPTTGAPSAVHPSVSLGRAHVEVARARERLRAGGGLEARDRLRGARELLESAGPRPESAGPRPDADTRLAARLLGRALEAAYGLAGRAPPQRIEVAPGGGAFRVDEGPTVGLERRASLRRILAGLVAAHRARPGQPISLEAVFALGWPGEKASPESIANRVYVAFARLRKLGVGSLIRSEAGGFMLDPEASVTEREP